jgi:hypothetical protein
MRPNHWIDKLLSAAAPAHHAVLRECATALAASNRRAETPLLIFNVRTYCGNIEKTWPENSHLIWQQIHERALFSWCAAT